MQQIGPWWCALCSWIFFSCQIMNQRYYWWRPLIFEANRTRTEQRARYLSQDSMEPKCMFEKAWFRFRFNSPVFTMNIALCSVTQIFSRSECWCSLDFLTGASHMRSSQWSCPKTHENFPCVGECGWNQAYRKYFRGNENIIRKHWG